VKGTQLVFCDLGVFNPANKEKFNVYTALRDKLHHEYNIPMYEIAFMQECKTQQHKDTVKNKFIKGDIRILFGSTSTLGTGNNVQNRIVAMHHLDTPWKPAEMDQRNGRGSRKGNFVAEKYNNNRVDCFLYATLNTLDNYKINLLHNKNIFIQQIRRHNLSVRSIDEGALDESGGLNYAEYVALLSGNLDLLQKCKIERQITVLESERNAYVVSIGRTERQLEGGKMDLGYLNLTLQKLTSDWEKFQAAAPPDKDNKRPFELEINGIRSNFFDEFLAKEIIQLKDNSKTGGKYQTIGQYYNFEVCIKTNTILTESSEQPEMHINKFYVKGENYYTFNNGIIGSTPSTIFSYFPNALEKIPGIIDDYKEKVSRKEESIQTCQRVINSKWDKEDQLNTLKSDLRMLETKIAAMINDIPTEPTVDKTPPTRSGYGKVPEV
jgi:hypothetical protein